MTPLETAKVWRENGKTSTFRAVQRTEIRCLMGTEMDHLAAIADAREAGREFSNLRLRRLWD